MISPPEHYKNIKENLSLTSEERALMRTHLETLIRAGTPFPARAVPSPFFFLFSHTRMVAIAALLLVVFSGSGASVAATRALPGDTLYAFKVAVNERVERTAALSKEARAKVDISHIEERLREVELLAVLEDTDARSVEEIREDIDTRVARVNAVAKELEAEGSFEAADGITSGVALTLATHVDILQAQAEGADDASGDRLALLSQALETDMFFDEEMSDDAISRIAYAREVRVREALDALTFGYAKETLREDTRVQIESELTSIEAAYEQAHVLIKEEQYIEAGDIYEHLEQRIHLAQALVIAVTEVAKRSDKEVSIAFGEQQEVQLPVAASKQTVEESATATFMVPADDASMQATDEGTSMMLMTTSAFTATSSLVETTTQDNKKLRFTIIDPEVED